MKKLLTALSIVLLAGCATTKIEVPEKYWPLRFCAQSATLALAASARTIGDTMYVSNLEKWIEKHPAPLDAGSFNHERVHAIQQKEFTTGRWAWIAKYVWDPAFMWEAEQIAYWCHVTFLRNRGVLIDVDDWAKNLHGYLSAQGPMVSEADAKVWLQQVITGQWQPAPADMLKYAPIY